MRKYGVERVSGWVVCGLLLASCGGGDAMADIGTPMDGGADGGSGDASASFDATSDAPSDAGEGDAGTGTPVPNRGIRLAYFASAASSPPERVDLCLRPSASDPWQRAFGGTGVGRGEVSRYYALSQLGAWQLAIIDAALTCDDAPQHASNETFANDSVIRRMTWTYTAGTTPGVTAGMRILRFGPGDVSGIDWLNTFDFNTADHMLRFNDGDGDEIISGVGLQVPAGTSGNLRMTFMSSVHDEPYRAGDGVGTSVFITGDDASPQFLFCDEFAPTSGALGSCSATLRAP